jgi:hypothetical protein
MQMMTVQSRYTAVWSNSIVEASALPFLYPHPTPLFIGKCSVYDHCTRAFCPNTVCSVGQRGESRTGGVESECHLTGQMSYSVPYYAQLKCTSFETHNLLSAISLRRRWPLCSAEGWYDSKHIETSRIMKASEIKEYVTFQNLANKI